MALPGTTQFYSLRLVPGGRYLVTSEDSDASSMGSRLCLWDLGNNVGVAANPCPLATMEASPDGDHDESDDWLFGESTMEIALSSSGKDILVLGRSWMVDPSTHEDCSSVVVYRINPLNTNPLFHNDGMLKVERHIEVDMPRTYTLNDSIAVVSTRKAIFVWNWAASTGCTWLLEEGQVDDYDPSVRLCDTIIISPHEGCFYVWDIPEIYPVPAAMREWPIISNPAKRFPCRHLYPSYEMRTMPTYQRGVPQHISVLQVDEFEDYDGDQSISLYFAQPIGSELTSYPPKSPVSAGWIRPPLSTTWLSDLIFCDGHLVMFTTNEEKQIVATVLPAPTELSQKDLSLEAATAPLFQLREHTVIRPNRTLGFCPMSGRIVHHEIFASLHILDFIPPLHEQRTC